MPHTGGTLQPRAEPLMQTGVHRRESGPRRTVTGIQLDGAHEHLAAGIETDLHHALEKLPALQVILVRLRPIRRGSPAQAGDFAHPCRTPGRAQRVAIESFGLEQPGRGRQVVIGFAQPATPHQRAEQAFVRTQVERCERKPAFQQIECLSVRHAVGDPLEQRHVPGAEAPPLRQQPAGELRAVVNLQPLEHVAVEKIQQRTRALGRQRPDSRARGALDVERIDETTGEIEAHGVVAGADAVIDHRAHLGQTPAQFAARIGRGIPQQFTELLAGCGARRHRQPGQQRACLARGRQCERLPFARYAQRSEQPQPQANARRRSRRIRRLRGSLRHAARPDRRLAARILRLLPALLRDEHVAERGGVDRLHQVHVEAGLA